MSCVIRGSDLQKYIRIWKETIQKCEIPKRFGNTKVSIIYFISKNFVSKIIQLTYPKNVSFYKKM